MSSVGAGWMRALAVLVAATLLGACAATADGPGDRVAVAQEPITVPVPTAPGPPETEPTSPPPTSTDGTPQSLTPEQRAFIEGAQRAEEERRQQQAVDEYLQAIARQKAAEQAAVDAYLAALAAQSRDRFLG